MSDDGSEPRNDLRVIEMSTRDELAGAVEASKRNLPSILAHIPVLAKMRRAAYLAYVNEGFTEAQALELCKS